MINKHYFYLFALFCLSVGNITCTPFEIWSIAKDVVDSPNVCKQGSGFQTEYQEKGVFRDHKNREFTVIVDFEKIEDRFFVSQTAKDIAQIASIAINSLELSKDPEYTNIEDSYKFGLQSFHVVVTNTQEEFRYLYNDAAGPTPNTIAFVNEKLFCWDDTEDIFFTIVIKKDYYQNIEVMTHELTHILSYHLIGNPDTNHNNPDLWVELDDENSMQAKILYQYELDTGLNAYTGGPVKP